MRSMQITLRNCHVRWPIPYFPPFRHKLSFAHFQVVTRFCRSKYSTKIKDKKERVEQSKIHQMMIIIMNNYLVLY